jgi:hypothetical protein
MSAREKRDLPMVHAEKANKSALWKAGLGWDS